MMPFQGLDFYNADSLLAEEERQVRDTVREWVTEKIIPVIEKHFREDSFPMELVPEMGELGFFGASFRLRASGFRPEEAEQSLDATN
jgi:glutaryl-CoA dehydrogenase